MKQQETEVVLLDLGGVVLEHYNRKRLHQGRGMNGKTTHEVFNKSFPRKRKGNTEKQVA